MSQMGVLHRTAVRVGDNEYKYITDKQLLVSKRWLLSHHYYPQSLPWELSCWIEEVNLTSSQVITMPIGHQRKCRLTEWQVCSAPPQFISQPKQGMLLTQASYTHTCTNSPLPGVLCCRITEAFFCSFNVCSQGLSWTVWLHLYRWLSLGSVSSINPSSSISFAFYQSSSTRYHYLHVPLKMFISRCLSDGQSCSLDDDLANKDEQKILPSQLEVIQMLSICESNYLF